MGAFDTDPSIVAKSVVHFFSSVTNHLLNEYDKNASTCNNIWLYEI